MMLRQLTREPFAELFQVGKVGTRHQELKQSPKFGEIVLKRRSGQQEPSVGSEHKENIPPLRFEVLDHMRLIKDHIVPWLPFEDMGVSASQSV